MIKAVIFDLDGVLIDAKDWHYQALNRALGLFGMEISRYDHLVTYDGLPTRKKLEMLTVERGLSTRLHAFINEMKQVYTLEIVYACCKPAFAQQYALAKLRQQGYCMAVCSNSVKQSVELMLERADIAKYMDFCLSNEDVSQPKPHPEIYLNAIGRLGLQPSECLVVEDNINGVRAATEAGVNLLVVRDSTEVNYSTLFKRIQELEAAYG